MAATLTGALSVTHINSNATTVVKTGFGMLHTICINSKGATGNTATVYDNTAASGTIIAVIDTTAQVQTLLYDAQVAIGITIVTAIGTAPDITVTYA